tara:strand:- start:1608 stop:1892 length:285 start_codon:yes stop_codon:yes gene_type:complete
MNKRELKISDKKLYLTTKEDIILKSPSRIPPKELQNLSRLKQIQPREYAYYDITNTENQALGTNPFELGDNIDNAEIYLINGFSSMEEKRMKLG